MPPNEANDPPLAPHRPTWAVDPTRDGRFRVVEFHPGGNGFTILGTFDDRTTAGRRVVGLRMEDAMRGLDDAIAKAKAGEIDGWRDRP